ncbi:MAG TPA: LLM class flavin-dependent oxidoreductase [Stellaceae bacterium]|nr:LLM class flavin-dependent oxidoreductase [Stellaceae bacterium]
MKLGFFTMPVHPKERNYTETLKEDREAFILADKLGYAEAFCGEHLTDLCENIPNSMMFVGSLMDATKEIKLGTSVANLPFSHPVVVATNAAMLDHLLEGRLILGFGAGILRSDAEALELLEHDRGAMFVESLDQVIKLWTGAAPYDVKGKFWNISTAKTLWPEMGVGVMVKPYQLPHPPIMGTVTDPNSQGVVALGRRGFIPATAPYLHANWVKNHWALYEKGAAEAGRKADRSIWRVARSIFVAEDDKVADAYGRSDADSPYRFYMRQLSTKLARARKMGAFKRNDAMADADVTVDYIMRDIVIAGSPNKVADAILALHEATGGFGTLLYCGKNWTDPALGRKSMALMAEKVMPAVNDALRTKNAAE